VCVCLCLYWCTHERCSHQPNLPSRGGSCSCSLLNWFPLLKEIITHLGRVRLPEGQGWLWGWAGARVRQSLAGGWAWGWGMHQLLALLAVAHLHILLLVAVPPPLLGSGPVQRLCSGQETGVCRTGAGRAGREERRQHTCSRSALLQVSKGCCVLGVRTAPVRSMLPGCCCHRQLGVLSCAVEGSGLLMLRNPCWTDSSAAPRPWQVCWSSPGTAARGTVVPAAAGLSCCHRSGGTAGSPALFWPRCSPGVAPGGMMPAGQHNGSTDRVRQLRYALHPLNFAICPWEVYGAGDSPSTACSQPKSLM
jgi:hypothetical protein